MSNSCLEYWAHELQARILELFLNLGHSFHSFLGSDKPIGSLISFTLMSSIHPPYPQHTGRQRRKEKDKTIKKEN